MSEERERENIRKRVYYVLFHVILFSIIYMIVTSFLFEINIRSQEDVFGRVILENWGIGIIGLSLFSLLFIIDKDVFLFRINSFSKFMISFFFSWFLGDIASFIDLLVVVLFQ